jgi:hypothetical protein
VVAGIAFLFQETWEFAFLARRGAMQRSARQKNPTTPHLFSVPGRLGNLHNASIAIQEKLHGSLPEKLVSEKSFLSL